MRRALSVGAFGAAVFIGTLITPGGRASADKTADPVLVTNVPLPVAVASLPASPRPFSGRESYIISDGQFGVSGGGTFTAPPNSVIETISVHVLVPAGQKPSASLLVPDDTGRIVASIWVPLQLQGNSPAGDEYVGTLTNVHSPMGSTSAGRQVNFEIDRDSSSGVAAAQTTVIGVPAT